MNKFKKILEKAELIFLRPRPLYQYDEIITGVSVSNRFTKSRAVEVNSFLYYQRNNLMPERILEVYQSWFISNKQYFLSSAKEMRTKADLEALVEKAYRELVKSLRIAHKNIEDEVKILPTPPKRSPPSLDSYNRIRKIIDLYIEHIVAMAKDFGPEDRERIVPMLSLPLDSQIFADPDIFTAAELRYCKISRKWDESKSAYTTPGYGNLKEKADYFYLQDLLEKKSLSLDLGRPFHPIYFDLKWSRKDNIPRYLSQGGNLFETNYGLPI